ncbi:MAG: hypothetical protein KatS3mg028_0975 [Bacteroidia bacterium]|nr:MAG: hypothetical protein KatS3mg028_0975 [Bacteroidia bacterium]
MNNILSYIQSHYVYHSKILSIGRLLISLIIIADLFYRYQNLEAHYTHEGVLPVSVIKAYYPFYQYYFSLHNLCDTIAAQKILFLIHFIFAFCLLLGWKTQTFTIINFILLLSLHHRNPLILQGGDDLLRITLFYMIFLPWGKFYSADSIRKKHIDKNNTGFSWVFMIFMINIGYVYLFSALLKTSEEWRVTGDAAYYALSLDTLRTAFGNFLYPHPALLKILTFIVYYVFEIIAPLLLIFSFSKKIRITAIGLIILLHLGNMLTLKVGIFPFAGIVTALMILPPGEKHIDETSHSRNIAEIIFASAILILITRYNLATLNNPRFSITLLEDRLLNSIGLSQRWNMFSPGVKRYDGWLVLRGIKKDNTEWDLIHNTPENSLRSNIPESTQYLKGDRWRKFLENYEQVQYNFVKPYFCRYLVFQWNKTHPENPVEALNILFVKKITLPDYQHQLETENLCLCNPFIEK